MGRISKLISPHSRSPRPHVPLTKHMLVLAFTCALMGCSGGGGARVDFDNINSTPLPTTDTSPDDFNFTDYDEAALNVATTSNQLVIRGIDDAATISIINGEYAIDGGDFTGNAGTITVGQRVQVRVRTSAQNNTLTETTLTVGDVADTFSVTTEPQRHFEAEAGALLVDAITMSDGTASNGQVVSNLLTVGSGLQLANMPSSTGLTLTYSSTGDATLSVIVNGNEAGQFNLVSTGGSSTFANAQLDLSSPSGANISITNLLSDESVYLDSLTLTPPPLQEVTTFANSGIVPPAGRSGLDDVTVADNGDVYVSGGSFAKNIVRITPEGLVSEFATGFESANGSDFDSAGNLYVADYRANAVRRITPDGTVSTFASGLDGPAGIYVDNLDNVIVGLFGANFSGTAGTVLRISPDGISEVLAQGGGLNDVIGVIGDENGEIYAGNFDGRQIYRVTDGNVTLLATLSVNINMIDYSRGYIYVTYDGQIVRVNTSTGEEELFSGTAFEQTLNGPVKSAEFVRTNSLAFSADGNILYAADRTTGDVRKIAPRN